MSTMELASDILEVTQVKNQDEILIQKLEEETEFLRAIASNVKELCRQKLLSKFESSENDKLLEEMIKSAENVQKSCLDAINKTYQWIVQFESKSENVLNDYVLFERAVSEMQANNLQRFQDLLPNILSGESTMNMTTEIDQKFNDVFAVVEKEMTKFTGFNDEYVQLNNDQKMLTKNMSCFAASLKKLNFRRGIEKKFKASGLK